MTIAERIMSLLRQTAHTQRDICLILGLAPSTVNDWFKRNTDSIPSAYVVPLAKFFSISPTELLTGDPSGLVLLSRDEHRLIETYRQLDPDGQTVVHATAITEARRTNEKEAQRGET